jgi:hypothetical protein
MPVMPPSIDVYSTDDMRQLANTLRSAAIQTSDYLANQCAAMHPRIAETLRAEGLDAGRVGNFGSTANQAASRIVAPGKKAADHLYAAASMMTVMWSAWNKYLVVPVEVARRQTKTGSSKMMKI